MKDILILYRFLLPIYIRNIVREETRLSFQHYLILIRCMQFVIDFVISPNYNLSSLRFSVSSTDHNGLILLATLIRSTRLIAISSFYLNQFILQNNRYT